MRPRRCAFPDAGRHVALNVAEEVVAAFRRITLQEVGTIDGVSRTHSRFLDRRPAAGKWRIGS